MLREHYFEQLPIEAVGPRLALGGGEARLEIEVVAARAVLEIEIDQTSAGLLAAVSLEQQHGGFDRERGQTDTAGCGQECVDCRLCRPGAGRALRGPRAGAH